MKKDNKYTNLISIMLLISVSGILSLVFYYNSSSQWHLEGVSKVIAQGMLLYLLIIFARTVVLIILSFLEFFYQKKIRKPTAYPLVSIIVPCFNEEKVLKNAIKSVAQLNWPNLEVVVIDDGSKDLTLEVAKECEHKGRVRVIYQENGGKAAALNRGISEAIGEYVLCVDADSVLEKDVIERGIVFFELKPKLAAVAGSVKLGNVNNLLTKFQNLEYVIGLNFNKTAQSFLSLVTIVPGPIGLFKKDVIEKIGGYHTDTYAEDCDLSMRLLMAGHEIIYCPKMIAHTEAPEEFHSLITQRYRWSRGIIQAIVKNSKWLFFPHKNIRNFLIILYMTVESIFIPIFNFAFAAVTIEHALIYGNTVMLGPYFIGLTVLDLILTLYSVTTERSPMILELLAGANRVTYGLALEILRFFAIIDEIFKLPMKWGTLVRKGMS